MKTFLYVLMLLVLLLILPGCDSNKEKGVNSPNQQKDLPRKDEPRP